MEEQCSKEITELKAQYSEEVSKLKEQRSEEITELKAQYSEVSKLEKQCREEVNKSLCLRTQNIQFIERIGGLEKDVNEQGILAMLWRDRANKNGESEEEIKQLSKSSDDEL